MRACSLLVIPPPKEREPPPGGSPKDPSDLNLSSWAGLVQDVASGLMVPPPNLGSEMCLAAMALLDLLEKTTGWVYCHFCYPLGSQCACMGAFPPSWSQVVGELPGCRATASSGGMTAPGMPAAGMSGYLLPPTRPPSHRLHQMEAATSQGPSSRRSHSPTTPPWGQEECQSSLRPIIPHVAAPLLPPLKNYVPGVSFEGTRDLRVMDHAMALRVAVWLHRLDMAVGGEG